MKVIIDPYRGGKDSGRLIDGQYEKNILLNISKKFQEELKRLGINSVLIRENDVSLTDDERNSIINEVKNKGDIIIQNRVSSNKEFDIIYPLRNNDNLVSYISNSLNNKNIVIDNYYQRRLPTNTTLDYYSVIRNTNPNETIIIEYPEEELNETTIKTLANTIKEYLNKKNIYTVQKGDTLYQIAKKYNTTIDELKKINNLINNNLSIGQKITIPNQNNKTNKNYITYIVQKGDTLYQIAKKYQTTIEELKKINNLKTNNLNIGDILKIPETNEEYINYIVQKGDTLYQIAKKYNVTVDNIKTLNNLTNNILTIGKMLKIPR